MKGNYLKITNPNKILFPKLNIKKIDLINYYSDISELMLKYTKNRLMSVIRCHKGIRANCFYKKHPNTERDLVNTFLLNNEEYFYLTEPKDIVLQAQMGTIEFHPWGSYIEHIDQPNMMVFDLDPDENLSLSSLRQGVTDLKKILDDLNLISFLKTSGGKGYHIVLPFSSSKNCSRNIAQILETINPEKYTTNIRKEKRHDKIFIDYLRNSKGSTCVAPYSIRARENATISMPISWDDLYKITPNEINIKNYKKYLNNAWDNYFNINQKLK